MVFFGCHEAAFRSSRKHPLHAEARISRSKGAIPAPLLHHRLQHGHSVGKSVTTLLSLSHSNRKQQRKDLFSKLVRYNCKGRWRSGSTPVMWSWYKQSRETLYLGPATWAAMLPARRSASQIFSALVAQREAATRPTNDGPADPDENAHGNGHVVDVSAHEMRSSAEREKARTDLPYNKRRRDVVVRVPNHAVRHPCSMFPSDDGARHHAAASHPHPSLRARFLQLIAARRSTRRRSTRSDKPGV